MRSRANERKYGVSFAEAESAFDDPAAMVFHDEEYSTPQHARLVVVGASDQTRIITVMCYVDQRGRIELFKARKATQREWSRYGRH